MYFVNPINQIKGQITINKTLHRKQKTEQTRTPIKTGVKSGAPDGNAVPAPSVIPVVLFLNYSCSNISDTGYFNILPRIPCNISSIYILKKKVTKYFIPGVLRFRNHCRYDTHLTMLLHVTWAGNQFFTNSGKL